MVYSFEHFLYVEGISLSDFEEIVFQDVVQELPGYSTDRLSFAQTQAQRELWSIKDFNQAAYLAFGNLFVWVATPEGHEYWRGMADKWDDYKRRFSKKIYDSDGNEILKIPYYSPSRLKREEFEEESKTFDRSLI